MFFKHRHDVRCAILVTVIAISLEAGLSTAWPKGSTHTVLYTFGSQINDGAEANVYVYDKAGNFYGSTFSGGANDAGTVFKLLPDGTETILYSFCSQNNCTDGEMPAGNLVMDKHGNLYGTTEGGGNYNYGTVFRIKPTGVEKVLYSFPGGTDGDQPHGGLVRDDAGNLYGVTIFGGDSDYGLVFKLATDGTYSVLHSFGGANDGEDPESPLIMDEQGTLYGTTDIGGTYDSGTIFKVASDGTETVLYSFTGLSDGAQPSGAGLTMDVSGNLYGVTFAGGNSGCAFDIGCGVVFKFAPDGTETTLYSFQGGMDGGNPFSTLVSDQKSDLFGVAFDGGKAGCDQDYGCGTVFEITPKDRLKILYSFSGGTDGGNPTGLIWNPVVQKGTLFGGTFTAGAYGDGVIYSLTK
jgi:uncharacterized repeat protein (TIGR03803 family)